LRRTNSGLYSKRASKDTLLFRLAHTAHSRGITPNMITALGLTFGIASGTLLALQSIPSAFALGFLSVFCDVLDGTLARKFHLESKFGLVFDAVSDRISETAVVIGAFAGGIIGPLGIFAVVGSTTLLALRIFSYTKGLKTDFAPFGRFERLVCIFAGLLIPAKALSTVCFLLAGMFGMASSFRIAWVLWHERKK
jgi:phosphatidylglycerophosphate synthase